jgi:hypothetical protein
MVSNIESIILGLRRGRILWPQKHVAEESLQLMAAREQRETETERPVRQ